MQKVNEIRHHIAAVEQTKKITDAMQLISTTRMRRIMQHVEYNQRYFDRVQNTMKEILLSSHDVSHRYFADVNAENTLYIVISADKGLAGDYNSNVLDYAYNIISAGKEYKLITMGNTAYEFFTLKGIEPMLRLNGFSQDPRLALARQLTDRVVKMYDDGEADEIKIIYTSFYGKTKNKPVCRTLLPIHEDDFSGDGEVHTINDIIYEPSPQAVFDTLVPQYLVCILYEMFVQSYASEHFARMNSMHNASTNAGEMIEHLKRRYNLARQTAITQEISETSDAGAEEKI